MELELLLLPVKADAGRCGSDLIFSAEFDAIREARRSDDPSLAQGEWIIQRKEAQWDKVIQLCEEILINKSKDLRVAVWLTEAHGKTEGLNGLTRGYQLLSRLCETYWADIHPQPDDGDQEQRIGALEWLLNQSAQWIRESPLTHSSKGVFSLLDHESALANARNIERPPELASDPHLSAMTVEAFDAAVRDTPAIHFDDGTKAATELQASMHTLQRILEQQLSDLAPSFTAAIDALDNAMRFFRRHAVAPARPSGSGKTHADGDVAAANPPNVEQPENPPQSPSGPVLSREQAIRQLLEISAFFRSSEPHSPVAYLAEKAARWGSMPLHEWLRTVLRDDAALARMQELLGVEPHN